MSRRQPPTPPLERPRRKTPIEEQWHQVQHFPPYGITPPPEFNELGDQLTNIILPPPIPPSQFLRCGDHLGNMVVHQPLPPPKLFGFGHKFPNMDVRPPH